MAALSDREEKVTQHIHIANKFKDEGNVLFRAGEYQQAVAKYVKV